MTQRTYVAFYNGNRTELKASSSYEAQKAAAVWFKTPAKKVYMISVVLADVPVNTASL